VLARVSADAVLVLHLAFIVFIIFGGLFALRWRRAAWLHVPTVLWGVWIELVGPTCPLTPLENRLREAAGQEGYTGGFTDHYIVPVVYPPGLDAQMQLVLAGLLVAVNAIVYGWVWARWRRAS
jgi:hypothetical protein